MNTDLVLKNVIVVGTGISGIGAAKLLAEAKAKVCIYDENEKLEYNTVREKLDNDDRIEILIGKLDEARIKETDLLVISPGVPIDSPLVERFKEENIPVWGEIELAYRFEKGKVAAITGTNGKTTTTSLVGEIIKAYNEKTFVVGNIGNSYTKEVLKTSEDSITVAEISSFQLETVYEFKAKVSAILNITPDHLNRHKTLENYAYTKGLITNKQGKDEICVLNYDDEMLKEFAKQTKASVVFFSRKEKPNVGAFMQGKDIKYTDGVKEYHICNVDELKIIGVHNYENVMAAVAIAYNMGVPFEIISDVVKAFEGVEHRIEYVATKKDVIYYNDSKGTNPDAAVKAIEAMTRPTILIGGGYDKKLPFDDYVKAFKDTVKLLVLIGETAEQIKETALKYNFNNVVIVKDLKEAVEYSAQNAKEGYAVLLSPACASWDMFKSYEQRGQLFKEYVKSL
ncbi:MAG: UDP-N-acetylmuramoyl-L-alanine--D-glutamate ligase [Lachnospiraceae bacterium]|nr:UDP-N-acetylmuramoyl-L-alanine--D-glutamate ligase [Lachnospiraceae bacterium]